MLFLSLIIFAFTIFTFVHCLRNDVKLKWLWAIGILLLYVQIMFTITSTGVKWLISINTISYSRLLIYPQGYKEIIICIPVMAILYWCLRKKITRKAPIFDDFSGQFTQQTSGDASVNNTADISVASVTENTEEKTIDIDKTKDDKSDDENNKVI